MNKFVSLLLLVFASACAADGKYAVDSYFIDSNVVADVYCDDKYLGSTPMKVDTSLTCILTLKKEGYNSPSFRFENLKKYNYQAFPSEEIKSHHGLLKNAITTFHNFISFDNTRTDGIVISKWRVIDEPLQMTVLAPVTTLLIAPTEVPLIGTAVVLYVLEGTLDILALPVDGGSILTYAAKNTADFSNVSSQNTPVTSYNTTSIDVVIPYDTNSCFFEMLPKDKKTFRPHELEELKTKLFVLKNFNELKASSPEYVQTLAMLTGQPFVRPEPGENPGKYFRRLR